MPFFVGLFFLTLPGTRRAIAVNLAPVLGPCGFWARQRRIWRTVWTFAWCLTERYERLSGGQRLSCTIEGEEHWRGVAGTGRGFIVVTAHIGHWEAASSLPGDATGRKVHVVREDEIDPRSQAFLRDLLAQRGGPTYETHFAGGDPALGVRLLEALRSGEIVALQGDRPRSGGRAVPVRLLGRRAEFPEGPAALARAAVVPLLPVFAFREGRLVQRVVIRPAIQLERSAGREEDIAAAAQELARDVEWAIRSHPHQWFCFRPIWT